MLDVPRAYCETKAIPPGFLVAALLAVSGLLWAVMFFGPLAHLERLVEGLKPFALRRSPYALVRMAGDVIG